MINLIILKIFVSLFLFLYPSLVFSYSITLSWYPPRTNADGTKANDIKGYNIYYGTRPRHYENKINVGDVTTYKVSNLKPGLKYYFSVTAYDKHRNESDFSDEVSLERYSLIVDKKGTGKGKVVSNPEGINCGTDCKGVYKPGTIITLTATPKEDSKFSGWSSNKCNGKGQCILTVNENLIISANFSSKNPLPKEQPTVFTVQAGAFSKPFYANYLLYYLTQRGYDAYMITSETKDGKKLYKVCVGRYTNLSEAESVANRIRSTEVFEVFVTSLK
ncbi:MAG: SPOR domain-containing protein [Thermodesulfovibrionales bacterium]